MIYLYLSNDDLWFVLLMIVYDYLWLTWSNSAIDGSTNGGTTNDFGQPGKFTMTRRGSTSRTACCLVNLYDWGHKQATKLSLVNGSRCWGTKGALFMVDLPVLPACWGPVEMKKYQHVSTKENSPFSQLFSWKLLALKTHPDESHAPESHAPESHAPFVHHHPNPMFGDG